MQTQLSSIPRILWLALAVGLAGPLEGATADESSKRNFQQSTIEVFKKIGPLAEAKNFSAVVGLIDTLLPTLPPTSYDMAYLSSIKAKSLAASEKLSEAIAPWELALKLGDQFGYFDEKDTLEMLWFLSNLSYQESTNTKLSPDQQKKFVANALAYLKRWLKDTKKVTPESSMLYASMLYQDAIAIPDKPDKAKLREMRTEVERGMLLSIAPRESFFTLLLAGLQQEQELVKCTELLEFLVRNFPEKKDYWPTLLSFYLTLMNDNLESNPRTARVFNVRAINTIERGQKLGNLNTPKDHYNLVTLYINAGQFGKATEMLHAGLKNGNIESDVKTWNILGSYYLQAEQSGKAIEAIQEAIKLFPESGQLELLLGEIYRNDGQTREGFVHFQNAVKKGNLEKIENAYQLIAYTGYELDEYEAALNAIEQVQKSPEGQKDQQLAQLKVAIQSAITQRDSRARKK